MNRSDFSLDKSSVEGTQIVDSSQLEDEKLMGLSPQMCAEIEQSNNLDLSI